MSLPKVFDRPISSGKFEVYLGEVLLPDLRRDDVIITNNLSSYKHVNARLIFPRSTASTLTPSRRHSPASEPFSARPKSVPSQAMPPQP